MTRGRNARKRQAAAVRRELYDYSSICRESSSYHDGQPIHIPKGLPSPPWHDDEGDEWWSEETCLFCHRTIRRAVYGFPNGRTVITKWFSQPYIIELP